jgi:hypothetical protein
MSKSRKYHCGHIHPTKDEAKTCTLELNRMANAIRAVLDMDPILHDPKTFKGKKRRRGRPLDEERFALQSYFWPDFSARPPRHHA